MGGEATGLLPLATRAVFDLLPPPVLALDRSSRLHLSGSLLRYPVSVARSIVVLLLDAPLAPLFGANAPWWRTHLFPPPRERSMSSCFVINTVDRFRLIRYWNAEYSAIVNSAELPFRYGHLLLFQGFGNIRLE